MVSRVFWVQDHVICKRTIWFFFFPIWRTLFLIPRGSAILNILHCCAEWRFSSCLTQTLKRNAFTCFSVTIIWCQLQVCLRDSYVSGHLCLDCEILILRRILDFVIHHFCTYTHVHLRFIFNPVNVRCHVFIASHDLIPVTTPWIMGVIIFMWC